MQLTAERLRELVRYDRKTGVFTARTKRYRWPAGRVIGTLHHSGYVHIWVDGKRYTAHRLAWLYVKGFWTPHIDHKNRVRHDIRWRNLRESNDLLNAQNRSLRSNTSGHTGVSWMIERQKWIAKICFHGEQVYLGLFDKVEDGARAYRAAKSFFFAL